MTALEFLAKLANILNEMNVEDLVDCEVYVADENGDWGCPHISIEHGDLIIYG